MRAFARIVAWLSVAAACHAQDPVEVVSTHVDSVSVTIYRDLFALVTETRTVDLPAGPVTLSFEGVVETLIPESAVAANVGRPLEERNYDFDQLTPNSLLAKSIGKSVTLTRTLPGSGRVTQTRAVILAANSGGIVLQTADGAEALHCSGLPEQFTFDEIPANLHSKPVLSIRLASGQPGKRTLSLSYLAQGFAWKSDYVARLNPAGDRMDLRGWVTLRNFTDANLRGANVQVVAGKLHLISEDDRGTSTLGNSDDFEEAWEVRSAREDALQELQEEQEADVDLRMFSGCHSIPVRESRRGAALGYVDSINSQDLGSLEEVLVTGFRASVAAQAVREELGDYQLYRLPWATDLNARQTKQAVFLDKPGVKVERFYGYRFDARYQGSDEPFAIPDLRLGFDNKKSAGLGEPLPEGILRLFETTTTGDLFAGEAEMRDEPVGSPVEITLARALDLQLAINVDKDTEEDKEGEDVADLADVQMSVLNAKGVPVTVEIRQALDAGAAGARIVNSNRRAGRKFGDFAWRFRVPANSDGALNYRLRVPHPVQDDEENDEDE